MITRRLFTSAVTIGATAWAFPASAHREKLTTTQMMWKKSSQSIEITHFFHIHHAETALAKIGAIPSANLLDLKNQAHLALYVEDNFSLFDRSNEKLSISTIGADSDGSSVFVYQEASLSDPDDLQVACSFLRPAIPGQINQINLDINGKVLSVRLSGRDTRKNLIAK